MTEEVNFYSSMYGIEDDSGEQAAPIAKPLIISNGKTPTIEALMQTVALQHNTIEGQLREINKLSARVDHLTRTVRSTNREIDRIYAELDMKVTRRD